MASVLTATGSGALASVGIPNNLTIASFAGSAAAAWTGMITVTAVFTAAGAGALAGVQSGVPPAHLTAAGAGTVAWVGANASGPFTATGTGTFAAVGASTAVSVATMTGNGSLGYGYKGAASWPAAGTFRARGAFSNNLPFNYPPSWSLMLYGEIIDGVAYDPVSGNLKIWLTGGGQQFIILQSVGLGVTQAIQLAADPEAYVLSLIQQAG